MRLRALLLIAALSSSGCALLASANASHNSGGTACMSSPAPATVDLVLASGMVAVTATQEAHPGYYALPALFFASGVIGGISAARCAGKEEKQATASPPLSSSAPSFGNAEVDPDARPATPEDMGIAPPPPALPIETIGPHPAGPTLTLDPNYDVGPGKPPRPAQQLEQPKKTDERIACGDSPGSCPKGQTCAIAGDDAGFCVRDRGR